MTAQATVKSLTSKYTRLTSAQIAQIFRLKAQNVSQREIARILECHESSVSRALRAFEQSAEEITAVLKTKTEQAVDDWEQASKKAASRGDHRPARELIEAAHPKLRPAQNNQSGSGVTVIVGMPGSPVQLPTINIAAIPSAEHHLEHHPENSSAAALNAAGVGVTLPVIEASSPVAALSPASDSSSALSPAPEIAVSANSTEAKATPID